MGNKDVGIWLWNNLQTISPLQSKHDRQFFYGDSTKTKWYSNYYSKWQDPIFTGNFWTELFSCLGTQLAHSSSYYPQSDGQTEIVNKCLEGYIWCFAANKQTQWVKWLPLAEWWYNTSFHTSTKMTPFMALYAYHIPSITSPHVYKHRSEWSFDVGDWLF